MSIFIRVFSILGIMFIVSLFMSHIISFEEAIVLMFSLYLYFTFGNMNKEAQQ